MNDFTFDAGNIFWTPIPLKIAANLEIIESPMYILLFSIYILLVVVY